MKYRILSDFSLDNVEMWMNDFAAKGWVVEHFKVVYSEEYRSTRYIAVMEKNEATNKPV